MSTKDYTFEGWALEAQELDPDDEHAVARWLELGERWFADRGRLAAVAILRAQGRLSLAAAHISATASDGSIQRKAARAVWAGIAAEAEVAAAAAEEMGLGVEGAEAMIGVLIAARDGLMDDMRAEIDRIDATISRLSRFAEPWPQPGREGE